jgi:EAL domain-containing protein (putative c-di-GMP-specific phosphodiesterase class I)
MSAAWWRGLGDRCDALRLLRDRRIDMVKIARPFVEGLGRDSHDRAVLSMLVQLGAVFGVQVVAEGIERPDQLSALAELGCELGQGYLLGRPLALEAAAPTAA